MTIQKKHMRKTDIKNVRRMAKYLRMRGIDEMSDGQVIRLMDWFFKRPEKKARGLITW